MSNQVEITDALVARFWSHVNKQGSLWTDPETGETSHCWEWKSPRVETYGAFSVTHKLGMGAHRFSWLIAHGDLTSEMYVCHKCDNRPCCNPLHLFLGTSSDNMLDASRKGRIGSQTHPEAILRGEQRGAAKMTDALVREIRKDFENGVPSIELARRHDITQRNVYSIVNRETWRHIP